VKLLIVEYINGGGYIGQSLPPALAAEGRMMLQVLLDELKPLPGLALVLPLDRRCRQLTVPENCEIQWLDDTQLFLPVLETLIAECDAVWPIAPESDGILYAIAKMTENAGKRLLLSNAETVTLCSDKLLTSKILNDSGIAAVETQPLSTYSPLATYFPVVLKPRDGVGCEGTFIVANRLELQHALTKIINAESTALSGQVADYVLQPFLQGDAISLSGLFKSGKAVLLSCNQQVISREDSHFKLNACLVNVDNPRRDFYQTLISKVAETMPGLWGYIGIDIIETPDQGPVVLEINPRLTTSYVGVGEATGINIAEQVLNLLVGELDLPPAKTLTVNVTVH
jgi:predicted ATP-grasp superfamily ATP-dependent carboligase